MNTQSLFRYAGIAAVISIVAFLLALALPAVPGAANGTLAMVVYAINLLTSLVPLFALYVVHRSEAPGLSLAAFVAAAASSLLSFGVDPTNMASPLMLAVTVLYALGSLLYGWLGVRSPRLPHGIGVMALIVGGLAALSAIAALAGAFGPAGMLMMVANLAWVAWFVWLSYYFLTSKSPAAAAAQG
jgi:hypothetical protein